MSATGFWSGGPNREFSVSHSGGHTLVEYSQMCELAATIAAGMVAQDIGWAPEQLASTAMDYAEAIILEALGR